MHDSKSQKSFEKGERMRKLLKTIKFINDQYKKLEL